MSARKLVAIMFTDIVGYTAVVGEDESKGVEARRKHRRLVEALVAQFDGRSVEETGDESLSSFGSAVDAVRCALAVQAVLDNDPQLSVRIGLHIGFQIHNLYGSNPVAIFLAKKSHRSSIDGLLVGAIGCDHHRFRLQNPGIHKLLDLFDLCGCHGPRKCEVEAKSVRCHQRSSLPHSVTQNRSQRQM